VVVLSLIYQIEFSNSDILFLRSFRRHEKLGLLQRKSFHAEKQARAYRRKKRDAGSQKQNIRIKSVLG
jgi:hypothetical protein